MVGRVIDVRKEGGRHFIRLDFFHPKKKLKLWFGLKSIKKCYQRDLSQEGQGVKAVRFKLMQT